MTKTLILVRHAKSAWAEADQDDFDRNLDPRGIENSKIMSKNFAKKKILPDKIFSSSAVRAISTAKYFARELGISENQIQKEMEIYNSGTNFVRNNLPKLDDSLNIVMFFGHNPDFTFLYNYYSGVPISNMPTCSVACLDFETDSWKDIESKNARVRFFERP
jgi:phosphohistidine phosphatase